MRGAWKPAAHCAVAAVALASPPCSLSLSLSLCSLISQSSRALALALRIAVAAAARPPPARIMPTAMLLVAAARGRWRVLATRRSGRSPLLRTSPGPGRAARADFAPRWDGRGGHSPR